MTKQRARAILESVWASQRALTAEQAQEITAVELPRETALDTCLRIAELSYDWRNDPEQDLAIRNSRIWLLLRYHT